MISIFIYFFFVNQILIFFVVVQIKFKFKSKSCNKNVFFTCNIFFFVVVKRERILKFILHRKTISEIFFFSKYFIQPNKLI